MLNTAKFKRIVVKVGTSSLTHENGRLNLRRVSELARILADLKNSGREIVLVSSGAVGVGCSLLGMSKPANICEKQAAAAVGQSSLMHIYDKTFSEYGYKVAQVLLTRSVVSDETGSDNVSNAFETLFRYNAIPIVNENDVISTYELERIVSFGDNDTLSAVVACLCKAELLIILSDIDGLYDGDPRVTDDARRIPVVREINDEIRALAGGAGTDRGTGGMATKIAAAEIAMKQNIPMVIINSENLDNIYDVCNSRIRGTLFFREDV